MGGTSTTKAEGKSPSRDFSFMLAISCLDIRAQYSGLEARNLCGNIFAVGYVSYAGEHEGSALSRSRNSHRRCITRGLRTQELGTWNKEHFNTRTITSQICVIMTKPARRQVHVANHFNVLSPVSQNTCTCYINTRQLLQPQVSRYWSKGGTPVHGHGN